MEPWQQEHITENLPSLLSLTSCNVQLLAELKSKGVFSDIDVKSILAEKTDFDKANMLYEILQTRINGYYKLIVALMATCQTGACKILLEIPSRVLSSVQVVFGGRTYEIKNLLDSHQIEAIKSWMSTSISTKDCLKIHKTILSKQVIQLIRDTIPKPYSLYIPRLLSRRLAVNPEVFEKSCPDVFVFKQIKRSQLRNFVKTHGIESSTGQLLANKITSRFILLDRDADWKRIRDKIDSPVHLLRYEETSHVMLVEATSGGSSVLHHHMKHPDQSNGRYLSEDKFIEITSAENVQRVCICDLPGMGKSLMLANIARRTIEKWPNKIVAFIQLQNLVLPNKLPNDMPSYIRELVSTSTFASQILHEISKKMKLEFQLFFDGLDEVQQEHLEKTKQFLHMITENIPDAKIYVTSRPVVRPQLEKALGVIAYDIQPFDEETQCSYLAKHWVQTSPLSNLQKLKKYAELCVQGFKDVLKQDNKNIAGVPLMCWLLAEVYSERAAVYADGNSRIISKLVIDSLMDIYTKFLVRQLGETKCKFSCMHKVRPTETQCDIACLVKSFHVWQALQLICPNLSKQLFERVTKFDGLTLNQILSPGILERRQNEGNSFLFLHRTFAEYLVAEYFAKAIFTKHDTSTIKNNSFTNAIEQLAFNEIFMSAEVIVSGFGYTFSDDEYRTGTYDFFDDDEFESEKVLQFSYLRQNVVAYFLNAMIGSVEILRTTVSVSPLDRPFFESLEGCLYGGYDRLLQIFFQGVNNLKTKSTSSSWLPKLFRRKNTTEDIWNWNNVFLKETFFPWTTNLLRVAAKFCNVKIIHQLSQFFMNVLNVDLIQMSDLLHTSSSSPMKIAIERSEYEIVQYLSDRTPLQNKGLIYACVKGTYFDDAELVDRRLDIVQLLLSKCSDLLTEDFETMGLKYRNPLLAESIHLDAIKFLVEKGADIRVADSKGRNVFFNAALYMSVKDFLDLADFLFVTCKARDWFLESEKCNAYFGPGNCFKRTYDAKMLLVVLNLLSINDKLDSNTDDDKVSSLADFLRPAFYKKYREIFQSMFYKAVVEGLVEITDLLLTFDSSLLRIKYYHNRTPLLLATMNGQINIIKLLVCRGANIFEVDSDNKTLLHFAAMFSDPNVFHQVITIVGEHDINFSRKKNLDIAIYQECWSRQPKEKKSGPDNVYQLFNWCDTISQKTALHYAAENELSLETLKLFLACGKVSETVDKDIRVYINAVDQYKRTALHYAVQSRQKLELVRHMIGQGADWTLTDKYGWNVAHIAAKVGLLEHLKYFVELRCDVNQRDCEGNNVLQCVVKWFNNNQSSKVQLCEIIQVLCCAGINKKIKNLDGKTAYDLAVDKGQPSGITKLLL